jgi:hypothetical protein
MLPPTRTPCDLHAHARLRRTTFQDEFNREVIGFFRRTL